MQLEEGRLYVNEAGEFVKIVGMYPIGKGVWVGVNMQRGHCNCWKDDGSPYPTLPFFHPLPLVSAL